MSTAPRTRPASFARSSSLDDPGLSGCAAPIRCAAVVLGILAATVAGGAELGTRGAVAEWGAGGGGAPSILGARQGACVGERDGRTRRAQPGDEPVHPASV